MLTTLGVLLTGIYLILRAVAHVDQTLTLVFGIVIAALALADLLQARGVLRA